MDKTSIELRECDKKIQQIKAAIVFWRFDVLQQGRFEDRLFDVQDHAENVLREWQVNNLLRVLDVLYNRGV